MKERTFVLSLFLLILAVTIHADVVTKWNNAALDAIRAGKTPPPVASRALAILHASIYDAVNGISRTHESYHVQSRVPASASKEAAASAAAREALVALFPGRSATFDILHAAILAAIPDGTHKRSGIAWGESVADKIVAWRSADGSNAIVAPPAHSGPGFWQPTPPAFASYLLPQWAFVTPFAMGSSSQFRPPTPPALDSTKWAADYNEVKALGAAVGSDRTPDQTQIALFWADGAGTETPPGHWNHIAQIVGASQGNTMEENARLFALLNIAMADAAICAWDAKYYYDYWRPVTAIRNGDLDGNPATHPDPSWSSFIITPPFPDYVSGHATFSGAASTVLALFYGERDTNSNHKSQVEGDSQDSIAFTTGSDFLPGIFRSFPSFSAAAAEAALSRLLGGIHFRSANEAGLAAGIGIGNLTFRNYLQPQRNRSRTDD